MKAEKPSTQHSDKQAIVQSRCMRQRLPRKLLTTKQLNSIKENILKMTEEYRGDISSQFHNSVFKPERLIINYDKEAASKGLKFSLSAVEEDKNPHNYEGMQSWQYQEQE